MKKLIFFTLFFFLNNQTLFAGDGDYDISKIPLNLLKKANAVIRLHEQQYELRNLEKMVIHDHWVISILNDKGDEFADLVEEYDKFNSIDYIEGTLYDARGIKIKSLKKGEIRDLSNVSDALAGDSRLKVHNFYYKVYPYTIEYEVKTIQRETMFFPQWMPVTHELVAIEKSNITISVPADYKLRYKAFNYKDEPVIITKDNQKEYTWEIKNYESVIDESYSPGLRKITPLVLIGPTEFQIEDYKGKMNDWKEFGYFLTSLNNGRDVLPDVAKQKVQEIIKDAGTKREKIYRLYEYLQKNTRYISIQLGIGGWRPFEASYVCSKGYGDCKALSNYMYALLKEAGILSYYTLVKAGDNADDIEVNFPSSQFNHVIICVPDAQDTTWLECTSQTVPPGYMGKFTGNRHALLITEEGGKLVSTPRYSFNDNLQLRNIKAVLDDNGTLNINAQSRYRAIQQDYIHGMINGLSKDKVKELLHERLDLATYDINDFSYKQEPGALPVIAESLNITASNYATITGKRLFIIPNIMSRNNRKLSADSTRKYDIQFRSEYKDVDSVEIELPKGYIPESMPQPVSVNSKFGNYSCSVKLTDNKLYYYRSMEQYGGRYPSASYADLVKFYETIYKADHSKVVLVKN